jgi:hypothetical protein
MSQAVVLLKFYPNTFWFFTLGQLAEIQKVSLARIICDNSDGTVGYIQPKAFRTPHEYVYFIFSIFVLKQLFYLKNMCTLIFINFYLTALFAVLLFSGWLDASFDFTSSYNRLVPCSNIPGIDFFKMLPL